MKTGEGPAVPARIAVVGSTNMDLVTRVDRLPLPGETVLGGDLLTLSGGKGANQAVAAARLGGAVDFIGCFGGDAFGAQAAARLTAEGINLQASVTEPGTPHGVALILVEASGQNSIAVAPGANRRLRPEHIRRTADTLSRCASMLCQLETPLDTVDEAIRLASQLGCRVILNPAPAQAIPESWFPRVDLLTPNEAESRALLNLPDHVSFDPAAAAEEFLRRGAKGIVITLGRDGLYAAVAGVREHIPAFPVSAVDTTAAGDAFCGALAVALGEGREIRPALLWAAAAAACSVTRMGAQDSLATREELDAFLAAHGVQCSEELK